MSDPPTTRAASVPEEFRVSQPITYAAAGVDVEAGDRAVELMRSSVARTHATIESSGMRVLGGIGAFAGLVDVSVLRDYTRPVLATSTDGVGTKVAVAQAMDRHDTIGVDLVAMVVDDIVVCGARPVFMTDYIACGRVVPERIAQIVAGIAAACEQAGCALVGGETAEHPGLMGPSEYDLAGAAVGVVEADALLGPHRVRPGDVVVALASSGLHANGYSLVRRIVAEAGWTYDRQVAEFGCTLGEELLTPTRVYAADVVDLAGHLGDGLHAIAHVTGGGLAANLARVLPQGVLARVDRSTWPPPPVFELVRRLGRVPMADLERTVNLGVGMVAVLDPGSVDGALARLRERGIDSWVLGELVDPAMSPASAAHPGDVVQGAKGVQGGAVELTGAYAG